MSGPTSKAGGEVVCWCTKCKLDRLHIIIAMVAETPKRVECLACHSQHNFRAPKVEKVEKTPREPAGIRPRAAARRGTAAPRGAAARLAEAAKLEKQSRDTWEKSIAGQPASAFVQYKVSAALESGQLVRHTKFGDGVVFKVIDRTKVEILFQDGPKTMAHAMA